MPKCPYPPSLKRYTESVRRADYLYRRAEGAANDLRRSKFNGLTRTERLHREAEVEYEHALEILADLLCWDPWIVTLLDRCARMDQIGGNTSPDPHGVPRLRTSPSIYAMHNR